MLAPGQENGEGEHMAAGPLAPIPDLYYITRHFKGQKAASWYNIQIRQKTTIYRL